MSHHNSSYRTITSVISRHSVIMQSLYSKDDRVTKYRPIAHTSLQDNINSLPFIDGRYSTTRARNVCASLIMSTEAFGPPSYWCNLSSNNDESLCKLLLLQKSILLIYFDKMSTNFFTL